MTGDRLSIVLHAPTAEALDRARRNAVNLLRDRPDARIEIVVNAGAVHAALSKPHDIDAFTAFCRNTLDRAGLEAPVGANVVANAVLHIAERQRQGWSYIRA